MSIEYVKSSFGFYCIDDVAPDIKNKMVVFNIANAAGYFPVIGTIIGIARIIFVCILLEKRGQEMGDLDKKVFRLQILRGAVEAVGLGVFYFSADLMVTIERIQSKIQSSEETPNTEPQEESELEDGAHFVGYQDTLRYDLIDCLQSRFSVSESS